MENSNWIKAYIIDVLPCMTALLYLLAVIYNVAFFSVFNIDVTDFLSFVEMLVSVIQPMLLLSVFLLLLVAIAIYILPALANRLSENRKHHRLDRKRIHYLKLFIEKVHSSTLYKSLKLFTFSLIVILPSCVYLFARGGINNFEGRYSGFIPIFMPILVALILVVCKLMIRPKITLLEQIRTITMPDKIMTFILIFIFAVSVIYESGYRDGKNLLSRDEVDFQLILTDNTIYDNSHYTYVKHINDRIFIYDKHRKSSVIVFEDNVLSLRMTMKNVQKRSVIDYLIDNFIN